MNPGGTYRLAQISDVDGTYCCHLSPKQLRDATREYLQRELGTPLVTDAFTSDEATRRLEAHLHTSPAIYPSLAADDSDEERVTLDTDDDSTKQAYNRYTALMKRAGLVKRRGVRVAERLATLREEWLEVEEETGVSWAEVQDVAELKGREGQLRVNRDSAEVRYAHRDPSDWQLTHSLPETVREELVAIREYAEAHDLDYTYEDAEADRYHYLCLYKRRQFDQLWKRHFAELGEDADHGRIVTRWVRDPQTGRYVRPLTTISKDEFLAQKIHDQGDELVGLDKALDSMRFRIQKNRERKEKRG